MKAHNTEICSACIRKHKGQPPCEGCSQAKPKLTDRAKMVEWFIQQVGWVLVDGMGGVQAPAITEGFNLHGVPAEDRGWMFRLVMVFIRESISGKQ